MNLGTLSLALLTLTGNSFAPQNHRQNAGGWRDANGVKVDPLHSAKGQISVLFFFMTDCPIANAFAPEVNRIISKYGPKGVAFSIVYVDDGITVDSAKKHAAEFGIGCATVLDPTRTLARRAGVSVSPEAAVIGQGGSIVYRGRIDDRATNFGKIRLKPTRQDLRLTLDALLSGRAVPRPSTPCIGCVIVTRQ